MLRNLAIFCLFCVVSLGNSNPVPYLTKCKQADSKCIKDAANAFIPKFAEGLPEFNVERLDPLVLKEPVDASKSGLNLVLKDMVTNGLKDCTLKTIKHDVLKSKLMGTIVCNYVESNGIYNMDGKLLIVNVKGNGKIKVVLRKLVIYVDADMGEKVGKDGVTYWDVKRFNHRYELKDKANIEFENLITGNDVIGRAASEVIENNSNDIVIEIGPPVIKAITVKIIASIRRFFNHVDPQFLSLD